MEEIRFSRITTTVVTATAGKNDFLELSLFEDGTLKTKKGRVGQEYSVQNPLVICTYKPTTTPGLFDVKREKFMRTYESTQSFKLKDTSELFDFLRERELNSNGEHHEINTHVEKIEINRSTEEYLPIEDEHIAELVKFLAKFEQEYIEENFTDEVEAVSDEDLQKAQKLLSDLCDAITSGKLKSDAAFRMYQQKIAAIIPFRIPNMRRWLVKTRADYNDKISEMQDRIDFLAQSKRGLAIQGKSNNTILTANGLTWQLADEKTIARWKKQFEIDERYILHNAYLVNNKYTEHYLDNYLKNHNRSRENGDVLELVHGSPTYNWWSIIKNGWYLRPEDMGRDICAKALGHGIYFGKVVQKSMNYTRDNDHVFIAVAEVAVGKTYYCQRPEYYDADGYSVIPDNRSELLAIDPEYDSLWSEPYGCYGMDEIVVYTDGSVREGNQDNIEGQTNIIGLLELSRA